MGKFGLAAIGIAAIGLYLLLGGDETEAPTSEPPVTQQRPVEPATGAFTSTPERGLDRYSATRPNYDTQRPGSYAPAAGYANPLAQGPGYAPRGGYSYAPGSGYPTIVPAPTPAYQYRPLNDNEKQRLEQQYPGGYDATLDPYGLPTRSEPGLAGMPRSGYVGPQPGMSPGYAGSPSANLYASPPARQAFAPSPDPYAAPQPAPSYSADRGPNSGVPNYGGGGAYSTQPPGYGFRPLDSAGPDRRWRDSYSTPPPQPQRRPSGNHRSPDWPPTAPGQRGTSADAGPLWAARGFWN